MISSADVSSPKWWPRILVMGVVLAAATWAGMTIQLETELLALLPPDLPSVRGLDGFSRQFASDREMIIVADETMPARQRGEAIGKLKSAIAMLPGVESVVVPGEEWLRHAPELAAWMAWNLPPERFEQITAALQPAQVRQALAEFPEALAGALDAEALALRRFDPLQLLKAVIPEEGKASAGWHWREQAPMSLIITAEKPLIAFQDCVNFWDAIQRTVRRVLPGETRLLLTGRPAFTAEISEQMRRDMWRMIAVAVSLSAAAFWAFYRSLKPLGWILLGQFLALGVALLGARLGLRSLNVISMGFGCILLGISMDYSILVYHHFASSFRHDPAVWRRLRRGIWFSAATTSAAFLVLVFASLPGLRQLALLVAGGLLASAWFATWLLPAVWLRSPPESPPFIQRASCSLAGAMDRRGVALIGVVVLVVFSAGWKAARNPSAIYAPDLARLQPSDSAAFRGQLLLAKQDPSATDAIYLVQAPTWDAVKLAADELARRFPGTAASPLAGLIPAPAWQNANAHLWPAGVVTRLRRAFAEAGLGEEWSSSTLAFCSTLDEAASGQASAFSAIGPMLLKLHRQDGSGCRAVVRIPGAADHPIPPAGLSIAGAEVLPVSWVALQAELDTTSIGDFRLLGGGALAAIVLLCWLAHRSMRLVALNIGALVLSLLLLAALLELSGTQLNPLSLLCVPLLLGLVVDYSLHVLMTLEQEQGDFRKLYTHIGAPILLTGLASCIGFGAPMLANQPALQNFGLVMDFGILSAVFACLFLLPVLSRLVAARSARAPTREP